MKEYPWNKTLRDWPNYVGWFRESAMELMSLYFGLSLVTDGKVDKELEDHCNGCRGVNSKDYKWEQWGNWHNQPCFKVWNEFAYICIWNNEFPSLHLLIFIIFKTKSIFSIFTINSKKFIPVVNFAMVNMRKYPFIAFLFTETFMSHNINVQNRVNEARGTTWWYKLSGI